jgi:hypothetical protein
MYTHARAYTYIRNIQSFISFCKVAILKNIILKKKLQRCVCVYLVAY